MADFQYPAFGSVEALLLPILSPIKDDIPGLTVLPYIEGDFDFETPYMEFRKEPGAWSSSSFTGDYRFFRRALVSVDTFTDDGDDGNGDARGAALQELAFQALLKAQARQTVVPGSGSISRIVLTSPAHQTNDWATGSQVVRYAALPKGMYRYEMTVGLEIRPDLNNPPDPLTLF